MLVKARQVMSWWRHPSHSVSFFTNLIVNILFLGIHTKVLLVHRAEKVISRRV